MSLSLEAILEVGIDADDRLFVVPERTAFDYIYREAMEIFWDRPKRRLHSPQRREWSHAQWFKQILAAAAEHGVKLKLNDDTVWTNVSEVTKAQIERESS